MKKHLGSAVNIMSDVINSHIFNALLLSTVIGEFLLPFLLKRYFPGYNAKTMAMSALGSPESPVRHIYNLWLIWLGIFLMFTAFVYRASTKAEYPFLSALVFLSIGIFGLGAGLISGIFSVNKDKTTATATSAIHGFAAAVGFMTLLFFPLLDGILAFKQDKVFCGFVDIISFALSLICFVCFVLGDKEQFKNTVLRYEGLWEQLTLLCMYIPFIQAALYNLISD